MIDGEFMKKLNKSNLDIVHIHSPFTVGEIGKNYAKKFNKPLIATLHSQFKQDFERTIKLKTPVNIAMKMIMKIFNSCDVCWAVNNKIKELYQTEYGLTANCKVRLNATSHQPVININTAREEINTLYGIKADMPVFLFVGRINLLKGVDFIVDSLKIVKDRDIKFKMLFVGNGQDKDALIKKISELNLSDDIVLTGKIDDTHLLEKIYARATLFLFPSKYDANSLVQIEASCQSTPTLFVKGARTASNIIDNVNGFISEDSPQSYAMKIIEILNDGNLYDKVSMGAKRDIYLSWEQVVKDAYYEYAELIKLHEKNL
jgi:glycosyltransferase involved in cell wall biosynthesis